MRARASLALFSCGLFVLYGCESSDTSSMAPVDAGGRDSGAGRTDMAGRIGPAGGTLEDEEVEITIPPGALDEDVTIRIRVVPQPVPLEADWEPSGEFYEITPHGLSFAVPITIALPYDGPTDASLGLVRLDDADDVTWEGAEADRFDDGRVRFETAGLSYYTVVRICPLAVDSLEPGQVLTGCEGRECGPHPQFAVCGECGRCDGRDTCSADGRCETPAAPAVTDAGTDAATATDSGTDAATATDSGTDAATATDGGTDAAVPDGPLSLTMGPDWVCAVRGDGTLWCWGDNTYGQLGNSSLVGSTVPRQVGTDTDWGEVADADGIAHHACALKTDGQLWCSGDNGSGQFGDGARVDSLVFTAVAGAHRFAQVAVGLNHACGVELDGTLWCWGANASGQLGTTPSGYDPTQVGTDTDWEQVSTGAQTSCAIKGGALYCWGRNQSGQLGLGDTRVPPGSGSFLNEVVPRQVGTDTDWAHVSMADVNGCATKDDGSLFCWGEGGSTQLGDGVAHASFQYSHVQAMGGSWADVGVGAGHACGVTAGGTLECWGDNSYEQVGPGTPDPQRQQVGAAGEWAAVAVGATANCGLKTDGSVHCWGENGAGQRGDPAEPDKNRPSPSNDGGAFASVTAGSDHGCGLATDGTLWCWGADGAGQLGNGASETAPGLMPAQIGTDTWLAVAAGDTHTCGIRDTGSLWCWGSDAMQQLGNGPGTADVEAPTEIHADTDWSMVAPSVEHTCGIKSGELWCWGTGSFGRLGNGGTTNLDVPARSGTDADWAQVSSGWRHSCGLKTDGSVWCWGMDNYGQVGDGAPYVASGNPSPIRVGTDNDWAEVQAGDNATCARKTNGELWCWGDNNAGAVPDGTGTAANAPVHITAPASFQQIDMYRHGCGVVSDGSLGCWGYDLYGQVGDGTRLFEILAPVVTSTDTDWERVTTGRNFTCGLKTTGALWCWGEYHAGQLARGTWWSGAPHQVSF